jgi:hypothetical protein
MGRNSLNLLDSTSPVPSWSSSTPSSNSLVVPPSLLHFTSDGIFASHSERQVVAASLTGRASVESLQDDIGDSLRCKDITGADCCFWRGIEETILGYVDLGLACGLMFEIQSLTVQGYKTPCVQGDILVDHRTHTAHELGSRLAERPTYQ